MRLLGRVSVLLLVAVAAVGCGGDKVDNSKVQTPNDAPIGPPQSVGGDNKAGMKGRSAPIKP